MSVARSASIVGAFVLPRWGGSRLYVLMNGRLPRQNEFRFERRADLFRGELDGFVRCQVNGRGRPTIPVTMTDGTSRLLGRASSTRAGIVNAHFPETPVVDVCVGEYQDREERPGWSPIALTLPFAQSVVKGFLPRWFLDDESSWLGEPIWGPRLQGKETVRPGWDAYVPTMFQALRLIRERPTKSAAGPPRG